LNCFGLILSDFPFGQVKANKALLVILLAKTDYFLAMILFKRRSTFIDRIVYHSFIAYIALFRVKKNEEVVNADMDKVDADDLFSLEVVVINELE
jgi:hypothetical protein